MSRASIFTAPHQAKTVGPPEHWTQGLTDLPANAFGLGKPAEPPSGLDAWSHRLAGRIRAMRQPAAASMREVQAIGERYHRISQLGSAALARRRDRLREAFALGREQAEDIVSALAIVREWSRRELGLAHYDVQLLAALVGYRGALIEMATGEGKSLVAATIAILAGWRGGGVHLVTVNDYLADRDAAQFATLFEAAGLSVAAITAASEPADRVRAYAADVTYLSNKEVAADFLRDRVAMGACGDADAARIAALCGMPRTGPGRIVQRGLAQAIVDEADSVLIDEAVTPLILSDAEPGSADPETIRHAAALAGRLDPSRDYRIDRPHRDVALTLSGQRRLAAEAATDGLGDRLREELVVRSLRAEALFERDRHYVVLDGKIVIVDEATGRLMPDRTWRDGLHQAVEAKEGVEITSAKRTLARISFQRFFRSYRRLTGMTGTAMEARDELWRVYGLQTWRIPANRPCRRHDRGLRISATAAARWDAVVEEVRCRHAEGRPVLIGTRDIAASNQLSRRLAAAELPHMVLNAVHHAKEAEIITAAGQRGAITVATNLAGRGTDIRLGPGVADLGGLHVILTERHASLRVDRQLMGRAARQGDPGSAITLVSAEDELLIQAFGAAPIVRNAAMRAPRLVFDLAQKLLGARARCNRERLMQQDQQLDRQLAFAANT